MRKARTGKVLLPVFSTLAGSHEDWAQGLKPSDYTKRRASPKVVKALVNWIDEVLSLRLSSTAGPRLGDTPEPKEGEESECRLIDRDVCRHNPSPHVWRSNNQYVNVCIGFKLNCKGKEVKVYEYAHRLVAWATHGGYNKATPCAMHVGGGSRKSCKCRWCVNPHHIEWGMHEDNAQHRESSKKSWN